MSPRRQDRPRVRGGVAAWALGLTAGAVAVPPRAAGETQRPDVKRWSVHELELSSTAPRARPYVDTEVVATFTGPDGRARRVRGFWDGGGTFRVRFTPTTVGPWRYVVASNDPGLHGRRGSLRAVAAALQARGFLRREPRPPYALRFDDGHRPFLWGQTYYEIVKNALAGDRWKQAIDGTRAAGMNKVRLLVHPWLKSTKPSEKNPYPQRGPFVDNDHDRPDLEYWRRLDEVVRYLGARDMLADLIVFTNEDKAYGSEAQDARFARYAIARYAAYPHVMWCLVNEWNYTKKPLPYWQRMGALFAAEDPWAMEGGARRALSIHQQTRYDFQFFDQAWLSHAIVQFGVRNRGARYRDSDEWSSRAVPGKVQVFRHGDAWGNFSIVQNSGKRLVVINDEYGYIGEPKDETEPAGPDGKSTALSRDKHRHVMWGIAAGAGFGSAGDKTLRADGAPYFAANWHDVEEYGDVRRLVDFFTKRGIEHWKLAPHNELVRHGARVYVAAEPGRQYVVYAAAGGPVTLAIAPGAYEAWRYDPRSGEVVELGAVTGGARTFDLPAGADWTLHLKRRGETARLSGPSP